MHVKGRQLQCSSFLKQLRLPGVTPFSTMDQRERICVANFIDLASHCLNRSAQFPQLVQCHAVMRIGMDPRHGGRRPVPILYRVFHRAMGGQAVFVRLV